MLLHESFVKNNRHLSDDLKKNLLENAVKSNSQFRAIKDQADQMHTQTGRDLTYDNYFTLVL